MVSWWAASIFCSCFQTRAKACSSSADNKGNLNSLFGQINWYTKKYAKLLIVILDLNKVPDLQEFIDDFEEKGAEVVILTEENVRFKRLNKKQQTHY